MGVASRTYAQDQLCSTTETAPRFQQIREHLALETLQSFVMLAYIPGNSIGDKIPNAISKLKHELAAILFLSENS